MTGAGIQCLKHAGTRTPQIGASAVSACAERLLQHECFMSPYTDDSAGGGRGTTAAVQYCTTALAGDLERHVVLEYVKCFS